MDEYYFSDGSRAVGPHSLRELQELFAMASIKSTTPVFKRGESEWRILADFCDLNAPECQPLELDLDYFQPSPPATQAFQSESTESTVSTGDLQDDQTKAAVLTATEEQKESLKEEDETLKQQRTTKHQLLRQIRAELDALWEAQRESIIARIRFEALDKSYEATRRRNRDIYRAIENSAIDYWRRSGLLTYWIRELTWHDHDFTFRLKGKTEQEKYASLQQWLEETRLSGLAGCYAFKTGKDYLYIGQATVLKDRIKQHEKKTYFTYASAVRVIIPKHIRRLNQLERLMILAHQPSDNSNTGISGRNPVDDCLDFKELITDF
jgi:hypothetical protein